MHHVERAPATPTTTNGRRLRLLAIPLSVLMLFGVIGGAAAVDRSAPDVAAREPNATSGYLEGIDISHWQNTIDWTKVAAAGKRFAIMKASQDTDFVDSKYAVNRSGAKAAGIPTTAYHFADPDTTANDAILEADHFVDTARLGPGDLIPALDIETSGGLSTTALTTWVKTWLARVKSRLDVAPMVYTSPAFWKRYLGDTTSIAASGYTVLWIAHWGVSAPTVAASNWGGNGWTFWQYSNCGTVSGISGCVDLDRFNGTDLKRVTYDPGFRLSVSRTSVSAKQGASAAVGVGIARTSFSDSVALSVSGLPAGATASFSPASTTGTSSTLTITTSKSGTVTPTGTFAVTVSGDGGDLTRTSKVNLVVTDGLGPVVSTPGVRLYAGGKLGSSSAPVRTSWSGSDPSGVSSYQVQRQVNDGAYATVTSSTTARLVNQQLTNGSLVRYRVRAKDKLGNLGSWSTGPTIQTLIHQQTSSSIHYSGTWRTSTTSSASGGSLRYSTAAGASASFTFSGASIAWVATKGSNRGSANVYVDDVYVAGVNLYTSSKTYRTVVFAKWWPTNGTHTIKIVSRGTSGHPMIDIDAFVRIKRS